MWIRNVANKKILLKGSRVSIYTSRATSAVAENVHSAEWQTAKPFSEIPGPKPIPFIPFGNVWRFLPFGTYGNTDLLQLQTVLNRQYGPIVKVTGTGFFDFVMIFDPKAAETVFRNEGPWPIRQSIESIDYYRRYTRRNIFGDFLGVGTTQGEEWSKMRSAVNQPMMQPRNVKNYTKPIEEVADDFILRIKDFQKVSKEMPADFANELSKWALESICLVALDTRLGCLENNANEDAQRMIYAVHEMFEKTFKLDFNPSIYRYVSTPTWRKLVKAMDVIVEVSMKHINEKIKKFESKTDSSGASVLEILLSKEGGKQIAITMAIDMMTAGIDTTSATTAIATWYLAKNPETQEKLYQEMKELLPTKDSKIPTDFANRIPYLKAAIKESQRLTPIAGGNQRTLVKDAVLMNYQIPKGTMILIGNGVMCRYEDNFKNPNDFIPERWLKETTGDISGKNAHPFVFMPFGFGPRMCIGRRMAELEMQVLLIKIFRNFKVSFNYEMEFEQNLLYLPKSPLRFEMEDRTN